MLLSDPKSPMSQAFDQLSEAVPDGNLKEIQKLILSIIGVVLKHLAALTSWSICMWDGCHPTKEVTDDVTASADRYRLALGQYRA